MIMAMPLLGQAILKPGDIAIIGMNTDGPDEIAFLALVDIPASETIYFTDRGWKSSTNQFSSGENTLTWSPPNGGLPAGSVIVLPWNGDLSNAGDQVIAYQGSQFNPTILAALNSEGGAAWQSNATNTHTSALPPGLVNGFTAVAVAESDNIRYNCALTDGNKAELLAAIHNPANWLRHNTYAQTLSSCSFNVRTGTPSVAFGGVTEVDEAAGTYTVKVYCDEIGTHTTQVWVSGAGATAGSDFNAGTLTATFNNSNVWTGTIAITDDNDCEGLEDFGLSFGGNFGVNALGASMSVNIRDNDGTAFTYFQGFEGTAADNWTYGVSPGSYNTETSGDPLEVYGNEHVWARIKDFQTLFGPYTGTYFWGMGDIDNNNGGGAFWHHLTTNPVSLGGIQHAQFSFKYITWNLDALDEIQYSLMFDNGSSWSNWVTLNKNTQAWTNVTASIPTGAQHVRFRFRTKQVAGIVCAGIDDIIVDGMTCPQPNSITTGVFSGAICMDGSTNYSVPFTTTGSFNSGNQFVAQLSDSTGSFSPPTNIGSLSLSGLNPSGTIQATIPAAVLPASGYRIRVVSTDPPTVGSDNGYDLTLSQISASLTSPTFVGGHNISCPGASDGSIDLTVSQGTPTYSYNWTGPNGFSSTQEDLTGLTGGTYNLTVTDAAGCVKTESITLTAPNLSLVVTSTDITCFGSGDGSISLSISGSAPPFSVAWTGPNGFSSTDSSLTNLSAGTYDVVVTDANGCQNAATATITQPGLLIAGIANTLNSCGHHISCAGASDGIVDLTVNGGVPPYSYSWTGPNGFTATTEDLSNLGPGSYAVTITDASNCVTTTSTVLTEPAPLTGDISADTVCNYNIACHGDQTGAAHLSGIGGGCPPYSFNWSNGATTQSATGLGAGSYSVTISDALGCELVKSITLTEPDVIQITATATAVTCSTADNGAIDITVTGGCPPYSYAWVGPNGFTWPLEDPVGLITGQYTVTVTDANGCVTSKAVDVLVDNQLSASMGCCQDTVICEGQSVPITVELTGPSPWFLTYSENSDTFTVVVNSSPYIINAAPSSTARYEIIQVAHAQTGCTGPVCGSATVAVNNCDTLSGCDDLCVNTGVLNYFDNGNCRTVTLEVACDTACADKTPIKSGGTCNGTTRFNFNTDPFGVPIPAGTIALNQWASMGITISVINNNGNHPQLGVIFDSGNPTGGDVDLGTPHQDFGGPGIGPGGAQGTPGENAVAKGNLLVIAENDTDNNNDGLIDDPDDEAAGGEMRFEFAGPYYVESLTMVDLDNGNGFIRVHQFNGTITDFNIPGLGDNAVTDVMINLDSVQRMRVILPGSGGVAAFAYCPQDTFPEFLDISVPCGTLGSYSNSAGLPMTPIYGDSASGITGLRIHGLPAHCSDTSGQGPFTVTYEVCGFAASCDTAFCAPLVTYGRDGCLQSEKAVFGTVATASKIPETVEIEGEGLVELYPNPMYDRSTVRITLTKDTRGIVEVFSIDGHRVGQLYDGEFRANEPRELRFRPTGDLPSGLYFVCLRTTEGKTFTRKFIVTE